MKNIDLATLEQLARAATPGPWTVDIDGTCSAAWPHINTIAVDGDGASYTVAELSSSHVETDESRERGGAGAYFADPSRFAEIEGTPVLADAAYIAAANPATVLALIAIARATPQHPEALAAGACDLPKLPQPFGTMNVYADDGSVTSRDGYTADQMRGYALDATTPQHRVTEQLPTSAINDLAHQYGTRNESSPDYHRPYYTFEVTELHGFTHAVMTRAQPLPSTAATQPEQTSELPPLPAQHDELRARWKCEDCDGTGEVGEPMDQGYFQPPERARCSTCDGAGQVPIIAYTDDQTQDYARAALSGRATIPSEADERAIVAGLKGLATHIRAAPHYARLLGDMCIVDQAIAALTRRATTKMCPTCNGNDANVPCAYPSKGMTGCLRTERILALGRRSPMSDDPLNRPCPATNNR